MLYMYINHEIFKKNNLPIKKMIKTVKFSVRLKYRKIEFITTNTLTCVIYTLQNNLIISLSSFFFAISKADFPSGGFRSKLAPNSIKSLHIS